MLTPGSTLGGRYRVTERIAGGGMGEVWKAEDQVLGRVVAVKVLLPALLETPGFLERFRGEARTMATINHPGVVDVYDFGESGTDGGAQIAYLVMEYVRGEPLSQVLTNVGRLKAARAMALIAQAAEALQAAHDHGITHRDVKPANLLVKPDGTLVLTDFGIARSEGSAGLTAVGSTLGTAAYMSPEQASGKPVGPLSDVYSLGVVAFQCVTGRVPFEADNPLAVALMHVSQMPPPLPGDVPLPVRKFIERAMDKQGASRWPSAAAMAGAARAAAEDGFERTVSLPPTRQMPPAPIPGRVPVPMPDSQFPQPGQRTGPGHRVVPPYGNSNSNSNSNVGYRTGPPSRQLTAPRPGHMPKPRKSKGPLVAGAVSFVVGMALCLGIGYSMDDTSQQNEGMPGTAPTKGVQVADTYSPSPVSPQWVDIDCAGLRNKSYATVESKLRKLGLVPARTLLESTTVKEGYVLDVPCQAEAGSTVKVKVAVSKKTTSRYPSPDSHATPASPTPTPTQERTR